MRPEEETKEYTGQPLLCPECNVEIPFWVCRRMIAILEPVWNQPQNQNMEYLGDEMCCAKCELHFMFVVKKRIQFTMMTIKQWKEFLDAISLEATNKDDKIVVRESTLALESPAPPPPIQMPLRPSEN